MTSKSDAEPEAETGERTGAYYDVLASRYPWATSTQLDQASKTLEAGLQAMKPTSRGRLGTRKLDWDRLEKIGTEVGVLIGPKPELESPKPPARSGPPPRAKAARRRASG